jgi:hypothetical protein
LAYYFSSKVCKIVPHLARGQTIDTGQPPVSPNYGGREKRGDTPKTPVLPRKDTSLLKFLYLEGRGQVRVLTSKCRRRGDLLSSPLVPQYFGGFCKLRQIQIVNGEHVLKYRSNMKIRGVI